MGENSYKNIMKGTTIFGGVQVFTILINLVRGKLVALFLGPEGMGISSLLASSMNTIQQFTCLGLNLSAVKEISEAKETGDMEHLHVVVAIVRKLLKYTAVVGALVSILFCSQLSELTFNSDQYKWYFVFLAAAIYFTTLANGELSILQGSREIKKLAFSSVIGALIGLFVGIPLYYLFNYDGIVPAMIVLSLATYGFYHFSSRKLFNESEIISLKLYYPLIKKMLLLGFIMMISSLLGSCANYALNAYIGRVGSLSDVGLYQAANSITNQYIGVVFTAMSLDFFPRLSAVNRDNVQVRDLVNKQIEIVILIIAPLACLLIIFAPLVIEILLTDKFISLVPLLRWMSLGLFLKAIVFPMGYISFSKGDKKTFFLLEGIWGNLFMLIVSIISYSVWGIYGLGVSLCFVYSVNCAIYILLTNKLYAFKQSQNVYKLEVLLLTLLSLCLYGSSIQRDVYSFLLMGISGVLCLSFCLFTLKIKLKIIKK